MNANTNTRNANTRPTLASTNARIDTLFESVNSLVKSQQDICKALKALTDIKQAQTQASKPAQQPKAAKKPEVKAAKKPALAKPKKGWEIVTYSDKSFLAYGEATRNHKQALKSLGGKFNTFTVGGESVKGWIFSSKRVSQEVVAKRLSTPTKATK